MEFNCYNCGTKVLIASGSSVGRRDQCESCQADLHCCKNCKFYDPSAYNDCKETSADRVLDKQSGNFCDFFAAGSNKLESAQEKQSVYDELDNLFKK